MSPFGAGLKPQKIMHKRWVLMEGLNVVDTRDGRSGILVRGGKWFVGVFFEGSLDMEIIGTEKLRREDNNLSLLNEFYPTTGN